MEPSFPATRLERLRDLLHESRPDLQAARMLVEQVLAGEGGALGLVEAKKVAERLLQLLVAPLLANRPDKLVYLEQTIRLIRQATTLQSPDMSSRLAQLHAWLITPDPPGQAPLNHHDEVDTEADDSPEVGKETPGPPTSLRQHLLNALRLLGEDEPWILETAGSLEILTQKSPDSAWPEIDEFLIKIVQHGHLTRSLWRRERELLKGTMVDVASGFMSTLQEIGRVDHRLLELAQRLQSSDHPENIHALRTAFLEDVNLFQSHARELKEKLANNQQQIASSQEKLRELDKELATVRDRHLMDPATGMPNRFAFSGHFRRSLEQAANLEETFTLTLFLVDDFAAISKRLGPKREIRLVKALGKRVNQQLRTRDFLARLEVDRFVILFPETDLATTQALIHKIINILDFTIFMVGGNRIMLRGWFGVVSFRPGMTENDMLYLAGRRALAASEMGGPGSRISSSDASVGAGPKHEFPDQHEEKTVS
ncbi:MAG: GGDEF domain-containing protein [Magnetococcales bacterium]|nr:GGDEF domain-containing protein [Magnetococcales bacterium]